MNGVINILKPPGMSSNNAVQDIRHIFNMKRAGHAGTLDPGAAGVLPVCIGRATRLFDYLVDKEKEYIAQITFGIRTDTQDAFGAVLEKSERIVAADELQKALPNFMGLQRQIAPMYSAVKHNGQKLYDFARRGEEVERKSREIFIHELSLIQQTGINSYLIRIRCSRGTYVRTLCEDIGSYLGTCAYMSFLLRTSCGPFHIADSYSIAELQQLKESGNLDTAVTSMEDTMSFLPKVDFANSNLIRKQLLNGCTVDYNTIDNTISDGNHVRVYCGEFLGLGIMEHAAIRITLQAETPDSAN